jgi:predicted lipoprotein with Yx(FWY)xxD motif
MKRLSIYAATLGAAVILAACGSSGYSGSSSTAAPAASAGTVSVKQVDGVGNVLVDSTGKALYSPEEEASGKVLCTGACTSFWMPLAAGDGTPVAAPGVGNLGVIDRPDGTKQVTAGGKPLYTFSEDSPGNVKGNGFTDDFGSQHFTWHAVLANGTTAGSSGSGTGGGTTPPSYGY